VFVGGRLGVAALTRYTNPRFSGVGATWGFEGGWFVRRDLAVEIAFDVGPEVERQLSYRESGAFAKQAYFATATVEYHRSRFLVGAGGGVIRETTERIHWTSDNLGPLGPDFSSESVNGAIAGVRTGVTFDFSSISLAVVAQGYGTRLSPDGRGGYLATLAICVRVPYVN
jgi:hypothetical protein